jgi:hypothetical protein
MTMEYFAVIDEAEEKIEKNRQLRGFGSCHHVWSLKADYLLHAISYVIKKQPLSFSTQRLFLSVYIYNILPYKTVNLIPRYSVSVECL